MSEYDDEDFGFGDVFIEFEGDDVGSVAADSDDGPRLRRSAPLDDRYYADRKSAVQKLALRLGDEVERKVSPRRRIQATSRNWLERTLGCVVVNFLRLRASDPGRYLAVKLKRTDYRKSAVLTYYWVSKTFKGLEQLGYVCRFRGTQSPSKDMHGLVTRFEALPSLLELFAEYKVGPSDVKCSARSVLVELRVSGKERKEMAARREKQRKQAKAKDQSVPPRLKAEDFVLSWPKAYRAHKVQAEQNLRKINAVLREQFIGLHVLDSAFAEIHKDMREENRYLDYFDTELHRVFTVDPLHNGRFAGGWWSTLPKQNRKHIRMSGPGLPPARTVHLDFAELHIRILYAQKQRACPAAPYELDDDTALKTRPSEIR